MSIDYKTTASPWLRSSNRAHIVKSYSLDQLSPSSWPSHPPSSQEEEDVRNFEVPQEKEKEELWDLPFDPCGWSPEPSPKRKKRDVGEILSRQEKNEEASQLSASETFLPNSTPANCVHQEPNPELREFLERLDRHSKLQLEILARLESQQEAVVALFSTHIDLQRTIANLLTFQTDLLLQQRSPAPLNDKSEQRHSSPSPSVPKPEDHPLPLS